MHASAQATRQQPPHRIRRTGVLLTALAAAVVWAVSASAISKPQTFSLLAIDNGKSQPFNGFMFDRTPEAGDQFGISEDLYRWAGTKRGAKIGSDTGIATFLTASPNGGSNLFTVQANLSGGSILVGGVITFKKQPSTFTLSITGGTGNYANTRGYVTVRQLPGNKTNLDFHLLP